MGDSTIYQFTMYDETWQLYTEAAWLDKTFSISQFCSIWFKQSISSWICIIKPAGIQRPFFDSDDIVWILYLFIFYRLSKWFSLKTEDTQSVV